MANRVYEWVDERTGIKPALDYVMYRRLPKSVNWFFTLGSASLTVFIIQAVSGAFLAMGYTPSTAPVSLANGNLSNEALESIRHTTGENLANLGYWVRGFHHWGANMMVIVVVLHMLRVFFMGSYKYPRELTWFTGVFILIMVLGFSFTGYLLPWDNRAYWATQVGVRIGGSAPILGDSIANVLRGGPALGAATLTRFYAIHVLLLPAITAGLIGVHLFLIIKIGISGMPKAPAKEKFSGEFFESSKLNGKKTGKAFFPYIIFKDAVVSMVVVALVFLATIFWPVDGSNPVDTNNPVSTLQTNKGEPIYQDKSTGKHYVQASVAAKDPNGNVVKDDFGRIKMDPKVDANNNPIYLDENNVEQSKVVDGKLVSNLADASLGTIQIQPQPEWYFLFLFQFLKLFPTEFNLGLFSISGEAVGGIIVPTILIGLLFFVPYLDRGSKRNPVNRPITSLVMIAILGLIVALTVSAITDINKVQASGGSTTAASNTPAASGAAPAATTAAASGAAPAARTAAASGAAPVAGGAGNAQAGLTAFKADGCAGCHNQLGKAAGGVGPKLAGTNKDDAYIANIIRNGKGTMPAHAADEVSDQQIQDLIAYVRSLK